MEKAAKKWAAWSLETEAHYTARRIDRASRGSRPTLRAFAEWLAKDRGLGQGSITVRIGSAGSFVDAVTTSAGTRCAQAFRTLTVDGIEDFFVRYGKGHGPAARRSMRSAMRLLLKFAVSRGWVRSELADQVPGLRSYRLSSSPRGMSDEQLSTLLGSPWEHGDCPRRDRAMVHLLATYGVRRQQISALRLVDIDWRGRTIDFAAHKAGKAIHHVLGPGVADAVAEYLRHERPASASEYVFLRHRPPHQQLNPSAITEAVRSRMVRCGLPRRGPHALRHSFATRLLRAGQPIKAIADLLGHRSLGAVAIYAKVDHARLLEVALEWPEVAS